VSWARRRGVKEARERVRRRALRRVFIELLREMRRGGGPVYP
jgi:hypothetical protein